MKDLQLKRVLRSILLVLLLSVVGMAKMYAQSFTVGDLKYYINDDGVSVRVTGHVNGTAATGELIIPESVPYNGMDYPVTKIGDYAFQNCKRLNSVTFPNSNSLTYIGIYAFAYDSRLYSITIPNSVRYIHSTSFLGTSWYNNQPDGILYLDGWCLGYKGEEPTGILEILEGTRGLAFQSFDYCTEITSVVFPSSMLYIGGFGYDCTGITSVTIPSSVIWIGIDAFYGCTNLNSVFYTGNVVQWCGISFGEGGGTSPFGSEYNLYMGNELVTQLDIPETVTSIGQYTFCGCSSISGDLIIPSTVTAIGKSAFQGCSGITLVTIPSSVTTMGESAFDLCNVVYYSGDIAQWCTISFDGAAFAYDGYSLFIENELVTQLDIPETVTSIGQYTFCGCTSISGDLILPSTVTAIGNRAFDGCSGITSVTIPNSVISIGYGAFDDCSNLTKVTMFATTPPVLEGWGVFPSSNPNFTIYVPYGSLNAYKTADVWKLYKSYIKPMFAPGIIGYASSTSNDKWNLIAVPLAEDTDPAAVLNMLSEDHDYDLYQYDQSIEGGEWRNYKVDSFNLVNGRGYLYATAVDLNLIIGGEFNEDETKVVNLDYDAGKAKAGWNLVGNPFPCNAYINRDYYVMNEDGTGINPVAVSASTPIPPCTGVFVKAEGEGETVVFTRAEP